MTRYARTVDVYPKIPKGPNGERYCRRCRAELPRGLLAWCSNECREDAYVRSNPSWARSVVSRRDKGVCADCGIDTNALGRVWSDLLAQARSWNRPAQSRVWWSLVSRALRNCRYLSWGRREHWWEADHVKPVSEGGGLCGIDGYRTLCTRCHDRHTGKLRSRLHRQKVEEGAKKQKELKPICGPLFD